MGVDVHISFRFLKTSSHSPSHTISLFFLDVFSLRLDDTEVGQPVHIYKYIADNNLKSLRNF